MGIHNNNNKHIFVHSPHGGVTDLQWGEAEVCWNESGDKTLHGDRHLPKPIAYIITFNCFKMQDSIPFSIAAWTITEYIIYMLRAHVLLTWVAVGDIIAIWIVSLHHMDDRVEGRVFAHLYVLNTLCKYGVFIIHIGHGHSDDGRATQGRRSIVRC